MRQLLFVLLFGLSACTSAPVYDSPGTGRASSGDVARTPGAGSGSAEAVSGLVESSRMSQATGDFAHALADIERAIRIEPRNPYLWLELGEIHLSRGDSQQATAMAKKAVNLAGEDRAARAAAERLLDRATVP
jgi:Flp pilus assembly protein TadD